ncbi:hypothetical protein L9F63_008703 [Diploptera punctata]|uniref:Uncharacterized protein n=1 Tax=Diploptera punctata TaxID=6984 RepID=A0AAD7Z4F3_DIPPU|nr:hypothetical protein L9F63_008703 [Diploptera punctata]
MASFRSGVKIFGEVSNIQGRNALRFRSYSHDRTILYQRPVWETKSNTPLQSSRVQLSLFGQTKPSKNEIIQKESRDLKSPDDRSWLSFFKKSVSREKPAVSCSHEIEDKGEHKKTLEKTQNSAERKLNTSSLTRSSRSDNLLKGNVTKTTLDTEGQVPSAKSIDMKLSHKTFKIQIEPQSSTTTTTYNLQPREQFTFTKQSNFQIHTDIFKQSNIEATKVLKSKEAHKSIPTSIVDKTTAKVKQFKSSNNTKLQNLINDSITVLAQANNKFVDKNTSSQFGRKSESNYASSLSLLKSDSKENTLSKFEQNAHKMATKHDSGSMKKLNCLPNKLKRSISVPNLTEIISKQENLVSSNQGNVNKNKSPSEAVIRNNDFKAKSSNKNLLSLGNINNSNSKLLNSDTKKNKILREGTKISVTTKEQVPLLTDTNKLRIQKKEPTVCKKRTKSKTSSTTLSSTNLRNESKFTLNSKVDESFKDIKMSNLKSVKSHDKPYISKIKDNISSQQKMNVKNSKLPQKSNETSYHASLPSNTQPFINLNDVSKAWNTAIFNNLLHVEKPVDKFQHKSLQSPIAEGNDFYKKPSFINYSKILGYGNRSKLESKVDSGSDLKKESNPTSLLSENINPSLKSNKENSVTVRSCNIEPIHLSTKIEKELIPLCSDKQCEKWHNLELESQEKIIDKEICSTLKEIDTGLNISFPGSCSTTACLMHFKSPPNQIIKRTFASFVGDPSLHSFRGPYKCQETTGAESKTPPSDASKKDEAAGAFKKKKPVQVCKKHPAPGCKVPESVDCKQKSRSHPPCDIIAAPKPSYSECVRRAPPPRQFTECNLKKDTTCPSDKKKASYDACAKKSGEEELVCPEKPPEKKKKVDKKKKGER